MNKYHHRWLNADKFDSFYPKFAKRSTVLISYSDYDKISDPVVLSFDCVSELTPEEISSSYNYIKGDKLKCNDLIEVAIELARTACIHKVNSNNIY